MKKRALTTAFLADSAGVGRGHLSDVLNQKSNVTASTLAKLAYALDLDVGDLLRPTELSPKKARRGRPKTRRTTT